MTARLEEREEKANMLVDTEMIDRGIRDTRFSVIELAQGTGLSRQAIYNIRKNVTDVNKIELNSAIQIQKFLNNRQYQ